MAEAEAGGLDERPLEALLQKRSNTARVALCTAFIIVCMIFPMYFDNRLYNKWFPTSSSIVGGAQFQSVTNFGTATSGKLFKGIKVNTFNEKLFKFRDYIPRQDIAGSAQKQLLQAISASNRYALLHNDTISCEKWNVVTTIFEPSDAVIAQAKLADWCTVVVGDRKGPLKYDFAGKSEANFRFLSAQYQEELSAYLPFIKLLPWNHFGRKNVGFIFAMLHGAKVIWDFDDDNILVNKVSPMPVPAKDLDINVIVNYDKTTFNPYPIMGAPTSPVWPRGFPLENIKWSSNTSALRVKTAVMKAERIGILQSLANNDPDVDGIYRLIQPLPFSFPVTSRGGEKLLPFSTPKGAYAPYNAQATLHMYCALWSLYLPVTVHGRVSDIWRGYIFQRLAEPLGIELLFTPPVVAQYRNVHNYLADFESENPLYMRSLKLVEQLIDWRPRAGTVPGMIEELWAYLYERDYIGLNDVLLIQGWIDALLKVGYRFPLL